MILISKSFEASLPFYKKYEEKKPRQNVPLYMPEERSKKQSLNFFS